MIIEAICSVFFLAVRTFIAYLSVPFRLPEWIADAASIIGIGLLVFPIDVWAGVIGSVISWAGVHFVWAIIEWVYKKIPGVD